ncbi:MAG TPA: hypothetical protein DCZ95_18180 [Verrucomicrobia bacterium]|nr:hypothetical protein [Verrucomicrobiota bacterium]
MKRLIFVFAILAACFGQAFALPPDGTGGWADDGTTTSTDRAVVIGQTGSISEETNTMTLDDGDGLPITLQEIRSATGGADTAAIHDNQASEISAITAKPTPADADYLLIESAANSNAKRSLTLTNLWANLFKGKADALYEPDITSSTDLTVGSLTASGAGGLAIGAAGTTLGTARWYTNVAENVYRFDLFASDFTQNWGIRWQTGYPLENGGLFTVDTTGTGTWSYQGVDPGDLLLLPADPAAHTLFGFDNTTNTYKPFAIGTGLSFDQATGTLSSTGGVGDDLGSAAYSDVVALWTTCSSGFLKYDGTCETPTGAAHDALTLGSTLSSIFSLTGQELGLTAWPTFNQNTTGTAAGLTAQYIDWNAASGGNSIANKPTLLVIDNTPDNGGADAAGEDWAYDHVAAADPHTGYMLESNIGFGASNYLQLAASPGTPDGTKFLRDDGTWQATAGTDTIGWDYTALTAAPASPVTGKVYRADNDTWDPITYDGTTDYFVLYTGSAYIGIVDLAGNLLIEGVPLASIDGLGTGIATALAVNAGTAGAPVINGGALGTPSSGTLTNATGLPLSGLVDSTSTAIGVGSVNVGHASDTTLARASAGVLTVEGVTLTRTIASGTSALGTAEIASGACATVVTTAASGVATTDAIMWGWNTRPSQITGYGYTTSGALRIDAYPTANNINFEVCNQTAGAITPGAVTLNWRVVR